MNPQNYVQDKGCEQADTFYYTFTVQHVNTICIIFVLMKGSHMNPNLQSIPLRVQHLGHRPQPNNLVPPNYPLVYFYSAEMPHLHTGLDTPLFVDNEGNKDRT